MHDPDDDVLGHMPDESVLPQASSRSWRLTANLNAVLRGSFYSKSRPKTIHPQCSTLRSFHFDGKSEGLKHIDYLPPNLARLGQVA